MAHKSESYKKSGIPAHAKINKIARNRDGSRTVLMSAKGWNGIKVFIPKGGRHRVVSKTKIYKSR